MVTTSVFIKHSLDEANCFVFSRNLTHSSQPTSPYNTNTGAISSIFHNSSLDFLSVSDTSHIHLTMPTCLPFPTCSVVLHLLLTFHSHKSCYFSHTLNIPFLSALKTLLKIGGLQTKVAIKIQSGLLFSILWRSIKYDSRNYFNWELGDLLWI